MKQVERKDREKETDDVDLVACWLIGEYNALTERHWPFGGDEEVIYSRKKGQLLGRVNWKKESKGRCGG